MTASLRTMAAAANTARGASWEHGARSATTLIDAADELDALTAERDALSARVKELLHAHEVLRERREEATARAERAERERDAIAAKLARLADAVATTPLTGEEGAALFVAYCEAVGLEPADRRGGKT